MRIAIAGWSSLIWCPRDLELSTKWRRGGPLLPVEYARKSMHDRVTLVLVPWDWVDRSATYWAQSAHTDLDRACRNLMEREGTFPRHIHFATLEESGCFRDETPDRDSADVTKDVQTWIAAQDTIDAVMWTGLPHKGFNLTDPNGLATDVVGYLEALKGDARNRAEEYVRYTPEAIRTHVRVAIEQHLEWTPAPLPHHLFE